MKIEIARMTVDDSDITFLAKEWEGLVSEIEYPRFNFAMHCLWSLCFSFMRGKGFKSGNYQSAQKNRFTTTLFAVTVVKRVAEDAASTIWAPTLCSLGFDNVDNITEKLKNVLKEYHK